LQEDISVATSSASRNGLAFAALSFAAGLTLLGGISADAASNPFELLKGNWQGGGTVKPSKGGPKEVTCKVGYKVSGSTLNQTMSCTGDDYEIEAKLKLTDKAGKVKGNWTEAIYDASGAVTGTTREDAVRAVIRGDKFSGRMSLKLTEEGHTINILQLDEQTGVYRLVTSLRLSRQ
jgi:hypothetical protein